MFFYHEQLKINKIGSKTKKPLDLNGFCDPRRIRTFDLRIRSALLYPAELWNHYFKISKDRNQNYLHKNKKTTRFEWLCDSRRIRTFDLRIRSALLYPAELWNQNKIFYKKLLKKVGVAGFEPAASCSQSRRDNRATLHHEANFKRRDRDSNPGDGYPSTD